jgi:hypothetical protein
VSASPRSRRLAVATASALVTVLMVGSPAHAQTVRHIRFSFAMQDTITDQCPFPIELSGSVSGNVQDFRDSDSWFVRVILHFTDTFTLSAKGTTLTERDRSNERDLDFAESGGGAPGRIVTVGNLTHVHLPSGRTLTVEAGRISEDLTTGQVTRNGHFTVSNDDSAAFCAAF